MLLSAALFGYFGYFITWSSTGIGGQFLAYVVLFEWTAKISAAVFLVAALVTLLRPLLGNLIYSAAGLAGAIALVVVLAMDLADTQHMVVHPAILVLMAAWNGYGSWRGLGNVRRCMALRGGPAQERWPDGR
jgi:hypothetical protein